MVLHNLADTPVTASVQLPSGRGPVELVEPLGTRTVTSDKAGRVTVRLGRYGSLWLRPTGVHHSGGVGLDLFRDSRLRWGDAARVMCTDTLRDGRMYAGSGLAVRGEEC